MLSYSSILVPNPKKCVSKGNTLLLGAIDLHDQTQSPISGISEIESGFIFTVLNLLKSFEKHTQRLRKPEKKLKTTNMPQIWMRIAGNSE
jgi:hypothetical protein